MLPFLTSIEHGISPAPVARSTEKDRGNDSATNRCLGDGAVLRTGSIRLPLVRRVAAWGVTSR